MSTPELERVSAAILAKVPIGYGMTKPEAVEYARAALLALLEPSEGMIEAGLRTLEVDEGIGCAVLWQAMIQYVLEGK